MTESQRMLLKYMYIAVSLDIKISDVISNLDEYVLDSISDEDLKFLEEELL